VGVACLDALLHPLERVVDLQEIAVLCRVALQRHLPLIAGRVQRQREVVVDVRVHARQRELDRGDALASARLEQRRPGVRHRIAPRVAVDGGEVQPGEAHVEGGQVRLVGEAARAGLRAHLPGHRQVQLVETCDAVGLAEAGADRLHPGDDGGDWVSTIGGHGSPPGLGATHERADDGSELCGHLALAEADRLRAVRPADLELVVEHVGGTRRRVRTPLDVSEIHPIERVRDAFGLLGLELLRLE